jgi:hypothetical protein
MISFCKAVPPSRSTWRCPQGAELHPRRFTPPAAEKISPAPARIAGTGPPSPNTAPARVGIVTHLHDSACDGDDNDDDSNSVMTLDKIEEDVTAHQQQSDTRHYPKNFRNSMRYKLWLSV